MNRLSLLGLLALVSSVSLAQTPPRPAPVAPPPPVAYKLDASKGLLYVQVSKDPDTLASSLSHDHGVRATGWTGTATWDPTNAAACKVDISVPVASLETDADDLRKKVGYDTVLDESQRAEVKEHFLAADQLNAAANPNITFKSTKCEGSGSAVKVTGNLTIRGVAKSVTVPMNITADGKAFSAKGSFTVNHTDFGFQPFSALLGQLKNKNEMRFTIDVKGAAQ